MTEPSAPKTHWRLCSICKTPIAFGDLYYRCSVSTCNRSRTTLTFCSVECWEAHVPTLRHRDAWAEEDRAPSREAYDTQERERIRHEQHVATRRLERPGAEAALASVAPPEVHLQPGAPEDILVVVSKLKAYIKARGDLKTSDGVMSLMSDLLREVCDEAIRRAQTAGRLTVLERDIPRHVRPED